MNAEQEKKLLVVLAAVFVILLVYRIATSEKPRTAPLRYVRGSVATSPLRGGISSDGAAGPLALLIERKQGKFPGVFRNIFRMTDFVPKPKPIAQKPAVPPPPAIPEKTPEELAKEQSRADLSKFRFLGYLTDKDSSLFLSKDGELYIVKSGDRILKNYLVKETGKDYVVLLDTTTNVDARIELSGSSPEQAMPQKLR